LVGPRGLPEGVAKKLGETFKKVAEGPEFQKVLNQFDLPYDYKDQTQLEKEIPPEYEMIRDYLKKSGNQRGISGIVGE